MLELAILGLLKEQELHGYELKKRLTDALGAFSSVSFGSLYPALARLEAAGAVRAVTVGPAEPAVFPAPVVPMTGSIAGEAAAFRARRSTTRPARPSRTRKVYALTERGSQLFEELLEADSSSVDDDRAFNLKLAFCRYLPPERRLGLFEQRRALLVERLARARTNHRSRKERMDLYTQSLVDHGTETTEADISWLDRLIAIERKGGQPS
ncbi:MAG: PadR family transcriptional regulator [Actinomycetota bacterium]|nr:PadR family transcriptional regulator [Actinomycetota bacterium]